MKFSAEIENAIRECSKLLGLQDEDKAAMLERCAIWYVLRDLGFDERDAAAPDIERLVLGGTGDGQLDAVAILLNGMIVSPDHDIESILDALDDISELTIEFVFVQATGAVPKSGRSNKIIDRMSKFQNGIQRLLLGNTRGLNKQVQAWGRLIQHFIQIARENDLRIIIHARLFWPRNLNIGEEHKGAISTFKDVAQAIVAPSALVDYRIIGEGGLVDIIYRLQKKHQAEISLANLRLVPGNEKASDGYSGEIYAPEFMDMICEPAQGGPRTIRPNLFFDNVRSFLGMEQEINAGIRETLLNANARKCFHELNHGVFIVARKIQETADGKLLLVDFQIVNGCQTSHVVVKTLTGEVDEKYWSDVRIPVRIICTEDEDYIDMLIITLNRQAYVDEIHLFSRRKYVIGLSYFFKVKNESDEENLIRMERRAREFSNFPVTSKANRVVSLQELMLAYSACFWGEAHANTTKKLLIKAVRAGSIFSENHLKDYYYLCAVIILRCREALNRAGMKSNYGGRSQIFHAFRLLAENQAGVKLPPNRQGYSAEQYLDDIGRVILDRKKASGLSRKALKIVRTAMEKTKDGKGKFIAGDSTQKARRSELTRKIEELCAR